MAVEINRNTSAQRLIEPHNISVQSKLGNCANSRDQRFLHCQILSFTRLQD